MVVGGDASGTKTVLFVCEQNACRSQMAAAIFNRLVNPAVVRAISAGTRPAKRVHPQLRTALLEIGIDLHPRSPRLISPNWVANTQLLITLACGDSCPSPYFLPRDEWMLPDPAGSSIDDLRSVRDEIASKVRSLVAAEPWL
jgi:arsenate reductase (thioredoxin)